MLIYTGIMSTHTQDQSDYELLTDMRQECVDTLLEAVETVPEDELEERLIDTNYQTGFTWEFREKIGDKVGCSADTVTRTLNEEPGSVVIRAEDYNLPHGAKEKIRNALAEGADGELPALETESETETEIDQGTSVDDSTEGSNAIEVVTADSVSEDEYTENGEATVDTVTRDSRSGMEAPGRSPEPFERDEESKKGLARIGVVVGVVVAAAVAVQRIIRRRD